MEEIEEGKKKIEESLCKAHVHAHIQSKNYHDITCILQYKHKKEKDDDDNDDDTMMVMMLKFIVSLEYLMTQ